MHECGVACHSCKESAVELEAVECVLGALDVAAYVRIDACVEHLGNLHGCATCCKLLVVLCSHSLAQSLYEGLNIGRIDAELRLHVVHESACGEHSGCIAQRIAGTQQLRIGRLDDSSGYGFLLFLVFLYAGSDGKGCRREYGESDNEQLLH